MSDDFIPPGRRSVQELERLLAEEKESFARFLRSCMSLPALVGIVRGPDFVYEFANDRYTRFGPRGSLVGKPFGAAGVGFPDLDLRATLERVYRTGVPFAGKQIRLLVPHEGGETEERFTDNFMQPTRNAAGEVDGVLIFGVDVTDYVRARAALQNSEIQLRGLAECDMLGLLFWAADGRVTEANDAYLKIVGYSREDLVAGRIDWLAMTPPEYLEREAIAHRELAERGVCTPFEKMTVRKDGRAVPILVGGALLPGVEGGGGVAFVLDIAPRKRAEEELESARATEARMQAQMVEVQKLESLGVLAGGIAHDFNNLLTGILGNVSVALLDLPDGHSARAALEDVILSARHAADLTRQMLAYSGKARFELRPIDLSAHVLTLEHLLAASVPKKVELRLELARDLPRALADVAQVQQILVNLVLNAAEALVDARGHVSVRTRVMLLGEDEALQAASSPPAAPGRYVVLEVEDDGPGIDPATRSKIFDPFFTTKFAGRGLGLAAVLGIVRSHSGAVFVDSKPGSGTRFRVLLPATDAVAVSAPLRDAPDLPRGATVLVVDDELSVLRAASRILESAGFRVLQAHDGRTGVAVHAAHANEIELVVLDLTMPELGGAEVLAEIRKMAPSVPVILSSGYSESEATTGLDPATFSFLQKPYRAQELLDAVALAIGMNASSDLGGPATGTP